MRPCYSDIALTASNARASFSTFRLIGAALFTNHTTRTHTYFYDAILNTFFILSAGVKEIFYKPKDYVNEISNTIPLTDCYFCLKELQNWIKNRLFWFFSFPPDEINLVLFPFYSEGWILNLVFHLKIVNNFVNNFLLIILKVINNQITNWNWKLWIETFLLKQRDVRFKCDLSDDQSSLRRFFLLSPQVRICWGVLPAGSYLLGVCGKKGLL